MACKQPKPPLSIFEKNNQSIKMKKLLFPILFSAFTFSIYSQENTTSNDVLKNELRIDAVGLVAFKYIDLTYEHLKNEESGLGVNVQFTLDANQEDLGIVRKFSLTPFYRQYFSKKYAKGFFVEGFATYAQSREQNYVDFIFDEATDSFRDVYENIDYNVFALGVSIGGKFVTKRGFVAEIFAGIGRNFVGCR